MKKLIKDIPNSKTTKNDVINSLKEYSGYIEGIKNLKRTGNRPTIISTYTDFVKLFGPDYFDETDNKTDGKADNEEIDTANMSDLKTKESAPQRKRQEAKGLKILTPQQMLTRLPISLAQLEAGNNSEKIKIEIRQLLHSLYR